jgi:hypothetical protein
MLTHVLGYPSQGAFRQALARGRIPVPVVTIEGRRGRFAQVADIARWLWAQRATPAFCETRRVPTMKEEASMRN